MKIGKRILGMMLAVVMACSLSISVFAMEPINESNEVVPVASSEIVITRDENGNITFETPDDAGAARIPGWANIVGVYVNSIDKNRVQVSIQNVGLDWVDSVSMHIQIYNPQGLQYIRNLTETSIKQMIPRNNVYYVAGWNRIVITNIVVKDEGDVGKLDNIDYWK